MLAGMGTELQCSQNFFTTLPRSHGGAVTISFDASDTRASSKDRPLKNRSGTGGGSASDPQPQTMERIQCHKESLRQTMLEHERIFKEQVRELHRLYRNQNLLMSQLQGRDPNPHLHAAYPPHGIGAAAQPSSGLRSSASSGAPPASSSPSTSNRQHHHRHGDQPNSTGEHRSKASLGSQELAICSQEHPRAAAHGGDGFDHRQPPAEGAPASHRAAQNHKLSTETTPSSCSDEECDLDLTLAIGCGGSKKPAGRRSHSEAPSGCFCPETSTAQSTGHHRTSSSTTAPARSDPSGPILDREREGLQRPAWLFQDMRDSSFSSSGWDCPRSMQTQDGHGAVGGLPAIFPTPAASIHQAGRPPPSSPPLLPTLNARRLSLHIRATVAGGRSPLGGECYLTTPIRKTAPTRLSSQRTAAMHLRAVVVSISGGLAPPGCPPPPALVSIHVRPTSELSRRHQAS